MTFQLFNVAISKLRRYCSFLQPVILIIALLSVCLYLNLGDTLKLLDKLEHFVLLLFASSSILRSHEKIEYLPEVLLLMPTHLKRHSVVHLGQDAPEHHVGKSKVLT